MDLKKIEYFLCSAESLNFSHAAKQLYISQQALSRQIQMLEREWGEKLFERTNTGLALTEVGRKACEIFRPLVSGLYRGEEELQTFIKYKQQVIRFAYFSSIPYSEIILPMVTEMQRLNPEVSIRMLAVDRGLEMELLESDSVDFVVSLNEEDAAWEHVVRNVIRTSDAKIVVSDHHPWYERSRVTEEDLAEEAFIVYENKGLGAVDRYFKNVRAKERIAAPNVDTFMGMLAQGQGFAIMGEDFRHGEGRFRLLDLPACYAHKAEIILAYKKLHPLRELFEQMKKAAGRLEHDGK